MTLKKAEESEYELYVLDTNEHGVSTAKSEFAEEHDVPYKELNGSKIHGTGNGVSMPYTRTSGDECLCVVVHSG